MNESDELVQKHVDTLFNESFLLGDRDKNELTFSFDGFEAFVIALKLDLARSNARYAVEVLQRVYAQTQKNAMADPDMHGAEKLRGYHWMGAVDQAIKIEGEKL